MLLFDGVEELDVAGPWEVLSYWCRTFPGDGYSVVSLSHTGESVHCAPGMLMVPDYAVAAAPPLEILLYPGGCPAPIEQHVANATQLDWVREMRETTTLLASVCIGALR